MTHLLHTTHWYAIIIVIIFIYDIVKIRRVMPKKKIKDSKHGVTFTFLTILLHFVAFSFVSFINKTLSDKRPTHHTCSCQGHESGFSISSLCPSCNRGTLYNPTGHLCFCHKIQWYSRRKSAGVLISEWMNDIQGYSLVYCCLDKHVCICNITWTFPSAERIPCFLISSWSSDTETNPSSFWSSLENKPRNWSMVHLETSQPQFQKNMFQKDALFFIKGEMHALINHQILLSCSSARTLTHWQQCSVQQKCLLYLKEND